jgi:hypothetical protein
VDEFRKSALLKTNKKERLKQWKNVFNRSFFAPEHARLFMI